ncbi:5' nucleotidase, NT5C type [Agromyces humi]|uniref:5' nucleotidase, NT5C type n=1 Tax=Agromyces humi TaxID=1766800 RepID=UPI00135B1494|nr:hypothetical protein [Agromyces humi]
MSIPFTVLLDIDKPIAMWEEGVVDLAREMHPDVEVADAGTREVYDFLPVTPEPERSSLLAAMNAPGLYRGFQVVEHALETIDLLLSDGVNVKLCSTPSPTNPTCASDKYWWVGELSRELVKRTTLTFDKTMCMGHVLVDDKDVITGDNPNPMWERIIYDAPYNQHATGLRLYDWRDLPAMLEPIRFSYERRAA